MKKLLSSVALFVFCWSFISMAQVAAPVAPVVAANAVVSSPTAPSGVMGWIESHGGFQAAVLLLVGSAFTILSALRSLCAAWDGIAPGAAIPDDKSKLSMINKFCIALGKILDFVQGNVQH